MSVTHQHATHHGHSHDHDVDSQTEFLDLAGEVLADHLASLMAWLPVTGEPRHILDLGCGTGTGTSALLARFPHAQVTAVDTSAAHLRRLQSRIEAEGTADRVRTVLADLDDDWPDLGPFDLVWASTSLHHLADPDRSLRAVRDRLTPGGLFAVVELADSPRFLPPDAPAERPGLEDRGHAALARFHSEHLPHRGADWGARLAAAGFTVDDGRAIPVEVAGSRSTAVARLALLGLTRLRVSAADALDAADLEALDQLLDTHGPRSLLLRGDLALRTEQTVWAARRS